MRVRVRRGGRELQAELQRRAGDPGALLEVCGARAAEFDAVHAATALHRLGKGASRAPPGEASRLLQGGGGRGGAEALGRLLETTAERLPEMGIRELSNALHGVANLAAAGVFSASTEGDGSALEGLLGAWEGEAGRKVHGANAQEVANLAWACSRLGLQPGAPLRSALLSRAGALAGELSPQGMAGVLLGAARLGWVIPEGVLAQLEEALTRGARAYRPRALANVFWAFARMGRAPRGGAFEALAARAAATAQDFNRRDTVGLLSSLATLDAGSERWYQTESVGACLRGFHAVLAPRAGGGHLGMLLTALDSFLRMGFYPGKEFCAAILDRAATAAGEGRLRGLQHSELVAAFGAAAGSLHRCPGALLEGLCGELLRRQGSLRTADSLLCVQALGRCAAPPGAARRTLLAGLQAHARGLREPRAALLLLLAAGRLEGGGAAVPYRPTRRRGSRMPSWGPLGASSRRPSASAWRWASPAWSAAPLPLSGPRWSATAPVRGAAMS